MSDDIINLEDIVKKEVISVREMYGLAMLNMIELLDYTPYKIHLNIHVKDMTYHYRMRQQGNTGFVFKQDFSYKRY